MVNIPRTEPRVWRRLPNCSATDTIAADGQRYAVVNIGSFRALTEKRGVCRHICTLQHLRKSPKCANNALNQLKCRLRTLAERLCQTLRVIRVPRHSHSPIHAAHTAIHASHPAHTAHTAVATSIHGPVAASKARVWRRI
jgi:hypothetical protein